MKWLGLLLSPSIVMAADIHIQWDEAPGATYYKVEQSVDLGSNWTLMDQSLTSPDYIATVSDTGMTLLRVSNCNQVGCVVRPGSGIWAQPEWMPPDTPTQIGVE